MRAEILNQVRGIAADLFDADESRLNGESSPENVEKWDSVQHLNLVLALEQLYRVEFAPEEMDQMQSIGQIAALVEKKTG